MIYETEFDFRICDRNIAMYTHELSVLDHLRQAAMKLRISGDDGVSYFDGLTERNIVLLLYHYYEVPIGC